MKKPRFTLFELIITITMIVVIATVVVGVLVQTNKVVYKTQLYNQNQQKESWIYLGNGNWKQVDQETYENAEIGGPLP